MKNILFFLLTLTSVTVLSQTQPEIQVEDSINLSYEQAMDTIFNSLGTSKIPSRILIERSTPIINWANHSGNGISTLNKDSLLELYSELYYAHIDKATMLTVFNVDSIATNYAKQNNSIPIMLLNFSYHQIKKEALNNKWIIANGLQLKDVSPAGQTPFEEKKLFAAAPLVNELPRGVYNFVLPPSLYFSNRTKYEKIQINFNDGTGYKDININSPISFNLQRTTTLSFQFITKTETLVSTAIIKVVTISKKASVLQPNYIYPLNIGNHTHEYGVWYGCESECLRKPFIIVEGYDPENRRNLTEDKSLNCSGQGDLNDENLYDVANVDGMLNKLQKSGYDIIILNFADGKQPIQQKAEVVKSLLRELKLKINRCGSNEQFTIMGPSEAGLVVRYALADMEGKGEDHNTKLFISFDAPHQGANMPLSLQHCIKFLFDKVPALWLFNKTNKIMHILNAAPTRQMLAYHYSGSAHHELFMSEMRALNNGYGYPKKCRNVAIADGSGNTLNQGFNPGDKLFGFNITTILLNLYTDGWALPNLDKGKIFSGIAIKPIPILNLFPFSVRIVKVKGFLPYDNAPGGKTDIVKITRDLVKDGLGFMFKGNCYPSDDNCYQNFIPTVSALDLKNTNDLFYNVHANITNYKHEAFGLSSSITPFDAIYVAGTNEKHVICGTTPSMIDFIKQEIMYDNLFLQNKTITSPIDFEATKSITTGKNVTDRVSQGDFIVQNTSGLVNLRSGNTITLKHGTSLKATSQGYSHIYIKKFGSDCDLRSTNNKDIASFDYSDDGTMNDGDQETNQLQLIQNLNTFPNPLSTRATIHYSIKEDAQVEITLYNLLGTPVRTIEASNQKQAGEYTAELDAKEIPAGTYICVMKTNGYVSGSTKIFISK
jgi:hypothetical protein